MKECRDIQLRYGSSLHDYSDDKGTNGAVEMIAEYDTEKVISDRLVSSLDFFTFDKLLKQVLRFFFRTSDAFSFGT